MTKWMETRLRNRLYEAAVRVYLAKKDLAKAQAEFDRLFDLVVRLGETK